MKRLTCEMCGSTDLVKEEGVFVCQNCGCKYSVEEARKMMIEGTVDVSGSTIKIDNSTQIENYRSLAESAYTANNYEEAESYYKKILELNPKDSHAWIMRAMSTSFYQQFLKFNMADLLNCFVKAWECVNDENCETIKTEIANKAETFTIEWLKPCCKNVADGDREGEYAIAVCDYLHKTSDTLFPLFKRMQMPYESFKKHILSTLKQTLDTLLKKSANYIASSMFSIRIKHAFYYDYLLIADKAARILETYGDICESTSERIRAYERAIMAIEAKKESKTNEGDKLTKQEIGKNNDIIARIAGKIKQISPHYTMPQIASKISLSKV